MQYEEISLSTNIACDIVCDNCYIGLLFKSLGALHFKLVFWNMERQQPGHLRHSWNWCLGQGGRDGTRGNTLAIHCDAVTAGYSQMEFNINDNQGAV
ncbi:hypothetical protein ES702_01078 [subsurface metagenome]